MDRQDEEAEIAAVAERLAKLFPDVEPVELAAVIDEVRTALRERPIKNHVPVLVELEALDRLRVRSGQR